ncbi:uncharacterized protein LAESUDRAFT_32360 [Laetiporus sulphureus 93-53]|uniref:Zn(2)-C6 fungal-type domain-containing protein n=1 Tax=Laetiporus sulphureus 93-53 TaxID=1314785 RepID=A0A165IJD9_9APHY|nr:uncharacterized protein LAESUDRAFT_32360 [Laetiporus sulphureus 93-53]KZT13161.1 hypothetical protein LAESUDRAFT_32360 [Laetiporus sulphureus 93-53]
MDMTNLGGERAGYVGPSRTKSNGSGHRSSPSQSRERGPYEQTLLTPVVRSKRTPIACTECRRRQVKCTGGTPQCERCEKKGVKCEYIPIQQQKLAAAAAASAQQVSAGITLSAYPASPTSRSMSTTPSPSQHPSQMFPGTGYSGYVLEQGDWQNAHVLQTQMQGYMPEMVQSAPAALGVPHHEVYQPNPLSGDMQCSSQRLQTPQTSSLLDDTGFLPYDTYSGSRSAGFYQGSLADYGAGAGQPYVQTIPSSEHATEYAYQDQHSQQGFYAVSTGVMSPESTYGEWMDPTHSTTRATANFENLFHCLDSQQLSLLLPQLHTSLLSRASVSI